MIGGAGRRARGFTLLELLVAVAVLGLIGAIAYRGLAAMARTTATMSEAAERFARVTQAVALLERDVRAALPRAGRDLLGDPEPALRGGPDRLSLIRGGWANPLAQPRPTLQRVTWARSGGELVRLSWPVLDLAPGTAPIRQVLLAGVDRLTVEFLPERGGTWTGSWPPPDQRPGTAVEPWPVAVRVELAIEGLGVVDRLLGLLDAGAPLPADGGAVPPPPEEAAARRAGPALTGSGR